MSTSVSCMCGTSLSVAETVRAVRCPNCGRELAADSKDRWGAERDEAADRRRVKRRKLALVGVPVGIVLSIAIIAPLFWLVPGYVTEPSELRQSGDNLRKIALALHNYYDTHGRLPPAVVYDKEGRPLYSWRVLILPFVTMSSNSPYEGFNLAEPWDSPTNLNVLPKMPTEYALPGNRPSASRHLTHYQIFDGLYAAFNSGAQLRRVRPSSKGLKPFEIISGGQTITAYENKRRFNDFDLQLNLPDNKGAILIAEADEPVPWTAPQDLDYTPDGPLPKVGGLRRSGVFVVGMADGSVTRLDRKKVSDANLRAVIMPATPQGSFDSSYDDD